MLFVFLAATLHGVPAAAASPARPYLGGPVPAGLEVEHHYDMTQWGPAVGGFTAFAAAYGLLMPIWYPDLGKSHDLAYDTQYLALPVVGPFVVGGQAFAATGSSYGFLAVTQGIVFFADGAVQVAGLLFAAVGIARIANGPRAFLVPSTEHAHASRVTVRPRIDSRSIGVGLSYSWR